MSLLSGRNLWFLPSTETVCDMADFESSHAQLTSLCQQRCYSPNQAAIRALRDGHDSREEQLPF